MDRFGTRIRDARLAAGLAQGQVAESLPEVGNLAMVESGRVALEPVLAQALCQLLRIPVDVDADVTDAHHKRAIALESSARLGDWQATTKLLATGTLDTAPRLFFEAFVLERKGEFGGAVALLTSALASQPSLLWQIRIMLAMCRCCRDSGDLQRSIETGEEALILIGSSGLRDDELETELRATLAGTYCETGGLVRALDLTEPAKGPHAPWSSVTRLWARAMTLQTMGRFPEADAIAQEALLTLRTLNRPTTLARMQNAAAWIAMQTPDFNVAKVDGLLAESAAVFRTAGAPVELALVLTSLAELEALRGRRSEADSNLTEALTLMASEDAGERARITGAAAQIYASMGDTEASMTHLLTARTLLEESGARRSAAATWKQMAATYGALGHTDLQVACLRAAMDLLDLQ